MNNLTPLDKHRGGKPVEKLKTNYKDLAKRYALAERMVYANLSDWKKQIVNECKVKGVSNHRIFNEFAHDIAMLAENDKAVLSEDCPPVPHLSAEQVPLTK